MNIELYKSKQRFFAKVKKTETCWLWIAAKLPRGYGKFRNRYFGKEWYAHRISWIIHKGPIPNNLKVLHSCDNTSCVNPSHLSLGTQSDNMDDKVAKGRANCPSLTGENNKQSRLTNALVNEIRYKYANQKISQWTLARQYGISQVHVSRIIRNEVWK